MQAFTTGPQSPNFQQTRGPIEYVAGDKTEAQGDVTHGNKTTAGRDAIGRDNVHIEHAHFNSPNVDSVRSFLHQLPPPVADFIGREKELGDLKSKIQTGAVISGVQGMGGIGKTQLALKLAHDLAPNYPDAQFYLDLRGADPEQRPPLTPADAMRYVLLGFDRARTLPETEDQLAAMYHSELHGRRAILLLDNALDAEQTKPLIPPATCLLLVTSRQHFKLPGMAAVDLEVLPKDKARELLLSIRPAIGSHADALAELCGYLPLALRVAADYLNDFLGIEPDEYLKDLRDERLKNLTGVEAALQVSVNGLGHQEVFCFHALSVFPASFDRAAAAAVWQLDEPAAGVILARLVKLSLLQWDDQAKRFKLHDLVRLVADKPLDNKSRQSLQRRHAEHYCAVAVAADALFLKHGDNTFNGLALFDREWPNIQTGFDWAAKNSPNDEQAARLCNKYPDAGVYCLHMRQTLPDRIVWLQAAANAANRLKNQVSEATHIGNLGLIYQARGDLDAAEQMHKKSLAIEEKLGRLEGMATDYGNLGIIYEVRGDLNAAEQMHKKAFDIFEKLGALEKQASVLGNLAIVYQTRGDLDAAEQMLKKSLAIDEKLGRLEGMANQYGNLGNVYRAQGELDAAEQMHKKSLAIDEKLGRLEGMASDYGNLGNIAKQRGDLQQARALWNQSRDLFARIGMKRELAQVQSWLDALPPV